MLALQDGGTSPISPREQQQEFYEYFGHANRVTWDYYNLDDDKKLLEKKIGYALFGPPGNVPDQNGQQASAALHHTGYDSRQVELIEKIAAQIIKKNENSFQPKELYMSILFVLCVHNEDGSLPQIPVKDRINVKYEPHAVFRLRKCVKDDAEQSKASTSNEECDGRRRCFIFIDHDCRVYTSWNNYIENNTLPKGVLVVPMDGIYTATIEGPRMDEKVLLTEHLTPASRPLRKLRNFSDTAGLLATIGSTCVGIAVAIPAIPVAAGVAAGAAVVGTTAAAYSVVRSSMNLADRGHHEQSINLADRQARNDWLGIAGGSVGLVAGGSSRLLGNLVGRGINISESGRQVINVLNGVAVVMNGVNVVHGVYQIFDIVVNENETPDVLLLFQVSTSIFFFTHSVINIKTADTIIREKQNEIIEEYRNDLRSNRHRKMFNKMEKETIRLAGNEASGKSEIIRAINNIQDKNDFFAGAVRINKGLNANNARISFSPDGQAVLNGVHAIDPMQFWAEGQVNQAAVFSTLPPPASNSISTAQLNNTQSNVQNLLKFAISHHSILLEILKLVEAAKNGDRNYIIERISFYLSGFLPVVQEIFMKFLFEFMARVEDVLSDLLRKVFPDNIDHFTYLFNFLYTYLSKATYDILQTVNNSFLNEMQNVIRSLLGPRKEIYLNDIMNKLMDQLEQILTTRDDFRRLRKRVDCKLCNGYYYVSV